VASNLAICSVRDLARNTRPLSRTLDTRGSWLVSQQSRFEISSSYTLGGLLHRLGRSNPGGILVSSEPIVQASCSERRWRASLRFVPSSLAPVSSAPSKLAAVRSAHAKFAPSRIAPSRFAPWRCASSRLAFARFTGEEGRVASLEGFVRQFWGWSVRRQVGGHRHLSSCAPPHSAVRTDEDLPAHSFLGMFYPSPLDVVVRRFREV